MALPINIEDLLNKRKVEGNRIEFKKGWNPTEIYRSICAFANDFDNLGGGYVLVGVEEEGNGLAKRPVTGINIESIDRILKQMVGFNKELELTEGRSTGVPTIQEKLADNGSPRATFETTEDRLTFLIHIPSHPNSEKSSEKKEIGSEKRLGSSEESSEEIRKGSEENGTGLGKKIAIQSIFSAIRQDSQVTAAEMAMQIGISSRAVEKWLKTMREQGMIRRVGAKKGGYWEIIKDIP